MRSPAAGAGKCRRAGGRARDRAPGGDGGSAPLLSLSSSLARTASLLRRGASRGGEEQPPTAAGAPERRGHLHPPNGRLGPGGGGCEGEAPLPEGRYKCPSTAPGPPPLR